MNHSNSDTPPAGRPLNAVVLQHAVLCADCDVVSDSPHDVCMVCGSRSLINISRILGGKMPENRAQLLKREPQEINREVVLHVRNHNRVRRRLSARPPSRYTVTVHKPGPPSPESTAPIAPTPLSTGPFAGCPGGVPNRSSAVRMCRLARMAAMMPMTRLRPSSIRKS